MKNRYKIVIGLLGVIIILSFIPSSFYSAEVEMDPNDYNSDLFYGTWKVTELSWFNESYFASDAIKKEMKQKVNQPIEDYLVTINQEGYTEKFSNDNYEIEKPQYLLESYDMGSDSEEIYNTINGCKDYLESLNITDKHIHYLAVRDPIKDKMDSGEIDWYPISTPIFIFLDKDTLLLTSGNCVEVYKCERVPN